MLYVHEAENAQVNETSMAITGPKRVLMGSLNLHALYLEVARMRAVAGWSIQATSC